MHSPRLARGQPTGHAADGMPIRITNLNLGIDEPEQSLADLLPWVLGIPRDEVEHWRILRKSLDARDKRDVRFVYTAEVVLPGDEAAVVARTARQRGSVGIELYCEPRFVFPQPGDERLADRPVVVGAGPAGMAAAFFLANAGYPPIVLERGRAVRDRIRDVRAFDDGGPHDPESNYLFGEGGAGTFSDGKLTCRSAGPDVRRVLELFAQCKGKPSILYDYRPHLGSNRLPAVVKALRREIEARGGEFRFSCRAEDLDVRDGRLHGVRTSSGLLATGVAVLAIGHSARDTYEMLLRRGVAMEQKPFQIGLRIEQPQEQVNRAQYGPQALEEKLGAADYRLVSHGRTNVFTFCMCAGGQIMPSISEPEHFCTNGMSLSRRSSPFANSGLMATLEPRQFGSDHVLAGMQLQRRFEALAFEVGRREYACPAQLASDFLKGRESSPPPKCSYPRGAATASLAELIPAEIARALRDSLPIFDRRWRGKFLENAVLVGPESRGSSPIRLSRDPHTLESAGLTGLYPVGEGAGFAGGIVSAALDGLRAAKSIVARYAPLGR